MGDAINFTRCTILLWITSYPEDYRTSHPLQRGDEQCCSGCSRRTLVSMRPCWISVQTISDELIVPTVCCFLPNNLYRKTKLSREHFFSRNWQFTDRQTTSWLRRGNDSSNFFPNLIDLSASLDLHFRVNNRIYFNFTVILKIEVRRRLRMRCELSLHYAFRDLYECQHISAAHTKFIV